MIFLASVVLFHFGNAAMLPMAGQVLAKEHPGSDAVTLSACIIAAQLVMVGAAWSVGKAIGAGFGRKSIFLVALSVLPVRGLLFSFTANPLRRCCDPVSRRRCCRHFRRHRHPDRLRSHARHRPVQSRPRARGALRRHRGKLKQCERRLCRAVVRLRERISLPRYDCDRRARLLRHPHARDVRSPRRPRARAHGAHRVLMGAPAE